MAGVPAVGSQASRCSCVSHPGLSGEGAGGDEVAPAVC